MNFEIPIGLTDLLQEFTVAVLRQRPNDLYQFAAGYFADVYDARRQAQDADNKGSLILDGKIELNSHENNAGSDQESDEEPFGKLRFCSSKSWWLPVNVNYFATSLVLFYLPK